MPCCDPYLVTVRLNSPTALLPMMSLQVSGVFSANVLNLSVMPAGNNGVAVVVLVGQVFVGSASSRSR